eukprot:7567-Heterococcus_DN1.PRE.1
MVIAALKKWKYLLHCRVRKGQTSCDITLQSCSPYLAQLHCELETWNSCSQANIEIPGQYSTSYTELKPELHARLLRFHSQVSVLHRYGYSQRRFSMLGSDGQRHFFLVQFATPHSTRSDERVMQLHVVMKRLLEKNYEARRRDMHIHIPLVIPITPRMRLMEDNTSFTSLGELHEIDMQRHGKDPDAAIILFRERITAAIDAESELVRPRVDVL